MSSSTNIRNAADNSRRPSTASGANARAPPSRVAARERPFPSGEVIPEDSASNAPPRRSASDATKVNGGSKTVNERQTSRVQLATRENVHVRTRSPVRRSAGDGNGERISKEKASVRPGSRFSEGQALPPRKDKKVLRESRFGLGECGWKILTGWIFSTVDAAGFSHCSYDSSLSCADLYTSSGIANTRVSRT